MFNFFSPAKVEFVSNPSLPDKPVVVPRIEDGKVLNKVTYEPNSNRSKFEGISFDSATMSLRAMLNLGVPLSKVYLTGIENDPTALQAAAIRLDNQISEQLASLRPEEPETIVESNIEE